ncbi:hypothetical protein Lal_00003921 [Lupinus albus]|nr:hypothetical protein Lal_00003921 [Lupinus albus]
MYEQLNMIEEKRLERVCHSQFYQGRLARAFDTKVCPERFEIGNLLLEKFLPNQEDANGKWPQTINDPSVVSCYALDPSVVLFNLLTQSSSLSVRSRGPPCTQTSSGLVTTGARDPITSALQIVLGKRVHLDIAQVVRWKTTPMSEVESYVRYAASFSGILKFYINDLKYGFYGDVITESEKYRWMGPKRYDYAGTMVFLRHSVGAAVISCRNEKAPDGFLHLILIRDCPHASYL